jgi:iron complex outermembrane recepter protein
MKKDTLSDLITRVRVKTRNTGFIKNVKRITYNVKPKTHHSPLKTSLAALSFVLVPVFLARAQSGADSLRLKEVQVTGYISNQPLLETPAAVGILNQEDLRRQADVSLLPALNTIPGVRMEERSPGSYRLSLRGSLLRSPFGVRNVKVYLDAFPLTDAGGNTYLNLIDPRSLNRIEILKGPDGSLFGANSGGVVLLDLDEENRAAPKATLGLGGGSYGLFQQNASWRHQGEQSTFSVKQAFQRADGYREQSAMRRHFVQASEKWQYHPNNSIKVLAFYADLDYETPGGLNQAQFRQNPRQARPAAGPNPGAVQQQAGIRNQTFFGGLMHEARLSDRWRHVVAVFGSHTDFKNPFITNYEEREEQNLGLRSYVEATGGESQAVSWKWNLGLEMQRGTYDIANHDNARGRRDKLRIADDITANQHFYFTRFTTNVNERLTAEAAVSLNFNNYAFTNRYIDPDLIAPGGVNNLSGKKKFDPEWMPRLGLSYLIRPDLAWRATVSRGYSPPSTAEIRSSNNQVNQHLEAELGWNYETGFRYGTPGQRYQLDAAVFYYRLASAIVRRLDAGGDEFFINAGGTRQLGAEAQASAWLLEPRQTGLLRGLQLSTSYTYSHFRFHRYAVDDEDYSDNRLTGVPRQVLASGLTLSLPRSLVLSVLHQYVDEIPLNDANTFYATGYNLLQAKLRWQGITYKKTRLELQAGADNLLNERYSLGNDINAFGNRFYNPAPLRNYFAGLVLSI